MIYTGVGSRDIPDIIERMMVDIAMYLEKKGYKLRSGGAGGSDTAFERGVAKDSNKEIFIPWNGFSGKNRYQQGIYVYDDLSDEIKNTCSGVIDKVHPKPEALTYSTRALHCRNVLQIMGKDLDKPSKFVILYSKPIGDNMVSGGTNTAYQLALKNNIPIYNLYLEEDFNKISKVIYNE